ncbi:hypothetical protein BGX30_001503 [Mortierella sp. GBA39]|nr:hypothetical protein BGX30_001503 [Mortierella sp. GBA39]
MEASIDSLDLTRPTLRNTTTTTSSTSSTATEPLQTADLDLATDLQGFTTSTNIKVEPEDPPALAQAAKASSPEVAVKQEPLSSDDATKFLPQASQPTIPSAPGLINPIEAEVGAQDPHYIVIRVSDESDFNDARRSNVWNTNPMYNKALRELYSPTSQVFLIFTVFMSSEFCGIAKMASEMMWVGERTIFDKSNLRQKFKLQWVACSRVSYDSVKEFTHEPIYKIIRKNGYELPQDIGGGIHKLLVENQPEEEPQPTLALQEEDSSALDIAATSFSQDMLMGEDGDAQESPTLHLNSLFRDTSDMDVDLPEPTTIDFRDKDEDQYQHENDVDSDEEGSSMDLDSNLDIAADLIEFPTPKATLLHRPPARKRSISADGDADLSMERALADEEQRQLIRDRSMEPTIERTDREADDEEKEGEDNEMEKGEAVSRRDVSPIRAKSPRKLYSPPPSIPSRRWSPSRRRSPPPPQTRSSRRRSPPPPTSSSRYWSPPPPSLRRNRSPPPPRRRPPHRRSPPPPPSHYPQSPPYERSGLAASTSSSYGFRSPPPFPQRSKDPRDRSASTYVFHTGSGPNYQRDRFSNAPTDPRLLVSRNASSSVVPQKRPYDEQSGSMEDDKGTVLADAVDLPASVFPLADDADDGMGDHFISPTQPINPSATGASSSSSSSAAPGGPSSSTSTTPSADPPLQITSITLIPAGMSKNRRKKMRKEALAKPLDF